jgi:hypothetical protein
LTYASPDLSAQDLRSRVEALAGEASLSPLLEQVAIVACVALLLAGAAIGLHALTRGADPSRPPLPAACRFHQWIRSEGGHFVCVRCSHRLP